MTSTPGQPAHERLWGIDLLAIFWLCVALLLAYVVVIGTPSGRVFALVLIGPIALLAWGTFRRKRIAWWALFVLLSFDAVADVLALAYCGFVALGVELPLAETLYPRVCKGTPTRLFVSGTILVYLLRPSVQRAFGGGLTELPPLDET